EPVASASAFLVQDTADSNPTRRTLAYYDPCIEVIAKALRERLTLRRFESVHDRSSNVPQKGVFYGPIRPMISNSSRRACASPGSRTLPTPSHAGQFRSAAPSVTA